MVFGEEDVCGFDVSVEDVHAVESGESFQDLCGYSPDGLFVDEFLVGFMLIDQMEDVSALEELGDDAEGVGEFIEEGVPVRQDEWVFDAG